MTPKQLKRAMERQWKRPGVSSPLRPAAWKVDGGLAPNYDLDVPDPDDGRPLDA